jgi:DnaJ-class molecular chaperone
MKDYYGVLGLTRGAGEREIKAAYRKLAKQYHPDVVKGDKKKEARMYEIQEAYGCLGDMKQREQYDQRLEEQGEKGKQTERKQTERKQRGTPGEKAGPMPDMDAFERFFGFQAGKGMETYHPKGDKGKKPEGAVDAEELFASFFGKIGR